MKDNSNQDLIIEAGKDHKRTLKNTIATKDYVRRLSYAAIVKVTWPDGTWTEFECGVIINKGSK